MRGRPGLIAVVDAGINRDIPDVSAAVLAAAWDVPVVDLNGRPRPVETVIELGGGRDLALSTRPPGEPLARELATAYARRWPDARVGHALSPIDVQCCYPFSGGMEGDFRLEGTFGDDLPLPAYSRFDTHETYAGLWRRMSTAYPLLTSVGCPFGCRFCAASRRKWRTRSARSTAVELERLRAEHGLHSFRIIDDCFNVQADHVLEFCRSVEGRGWWWTCANGLRADRFDDGLASTMARAGCRHVSFGVESLDPGVLAATGKGETPEQIIKALRTAARHFPTAAGFFLVGLPGSTFGKDLGSLLAGLRAGIDLHVSYYVEDAGAPFWGQGARPGSAGYPGILQRCAYTLGWSGSRIARLGRRLGSGGAGRWRPV